MSKPRSGVGTIILFRQSREGYFLTFKQAGRKGDITRVIAPEVAVEMAKRYGVRARYAPTSSMTALKGAAFRYRETSQGLLVEVEVLPA